MSLPKLGHRVRLVILWDRRNGKEAVKFLVTNRVQWEIHRILGVYRKRWTGTETFHRDGKHHLGMGDCQLRSGEGQTRHMYLVMLAHSLLMAQMRQGRARDWAHTVLTTIGEACRAASRETLSMTISWVADQATIGWTEQRNVAHLKLEIMQEPGAKLGQGELLVHLAEFLHHVPDRLDSKPPPRSPQRGPPKGRAPRWPGPIRGPAAILPISKGGVFFERLNEGRGGILPGDRTR